MANLRDGIAGIGTAVACFGERIGKEALTKAAVGKPAAKEGTGKEFSKVEGFAIGLTPDPFPQRLFFSSRRLWEKKERRNVRMEEEKQLNVLFFSHPFYSSVPK